MNTLKHPRSSTHNDRYRCWLLPQLFCDAVSETGLAIEHNLIRRILMLYRLLKCHRLDLWDRLTVDTTGMDITGWDGQFHASLNELLGHVHDHYPDHYLRCHVDAISLCVTVEWPAKEATQRQCEHCFATLEFAWAQPPARHGVTVYELLYLPCMSCNTIVHVINWDRATDRIYCQACMYKVEFKEYYQTQADRRLKARK
jgi:DNA-directed RNA polymerase subunit RPC12/RpoP